MRKIILFLFFLTNWSVPGAGAQEVTGKPFLLMTGHPGRPPFVYQDGDSIVGLGPDVAGIALNRLGVPYENRFTGPWKRVQELARMGEVDMIAGIYRNSERDAYLAFSDPFFADLTSVFVKKKKAFAVTSRQDLVGRRGVTLFGDSFGEHFDHFIDNHLRMIRVYSLEKMFELLLNEKADYAVFGYYAGRMAAMQMEVEREIIVALKNLVVESVHLALSRQSPYIHLLPAINQEIRKLREGGEIAELIDEYMIRFPLKNNGSASRPPTSPPFPGR